MSLASSQPAAIQRLVDRDMSSNLSIDAPDEEKGKDPKFSPVFMSPGGTFVKPTRPDVKLTPQSSATAIGISKEAMANEMSKELASLNLNLAAAGRDDSVGIGESGVEGMGANNASESMVPGYDGQSWGVKRGIEQDLGLFGGAILITLPSRMEDVSDVRQVPDHQEVFVDKETDISFIIEILNYEESTNDDNAALFHFNDLAQCNSAVQTQVDSSEVFDAARIEETQFMSQMRPEDVKCILVGRQTVSKFNVGPNGSMDDVLIFLTVVRMPQLGTDLLVSLNVPATKASTGDSVSRSQAESNDKATVAPTVPVEAFFPSSTFFSCHVPATRIRFTVGTGNARTVVAFPFRFRVT